jgi:hypothetical protein
MPVKNTFAEPKRRFSGPGVFSCHRGCKNQTVPAHVRQGRAG